MRDKLKIVAVNQKLKFQNPITTYSNSPQFEQHQIQQAIQNNLQISSTTSASQSNTHSTPVDSLKDRLALAWAHHPLTTLKLICNLRGVRGTGKSDKNGFYTAAFWLHNLHPKTLAYNLRSFAEFGYFKDFPEILFRILGLTRPGKMRKRPNSNPTRGPFPMKRKSKKKKMMKKKKKEWKPVGGRIRADVIRQERESEAAAKLCHQKRAEMAKKAVERYNLDPDYKFLHDRISNLFVDHLKSDLEALKSGTLNKISLAAKWCPSLDSSFDRTKRILARIHQPQIPHSRTESI